jgi:hypothetical protein
MKKKIAMIVTITIMTITTPVISNAKDNEAHQGYEYAKKDDVLRYNPFSERYEYAGEDDVLRYNPFSEHYEYAGEDDELRYNPSE